MRGMISGDHIAEQRRAFPRDPLGNLFMSYPPGTPDKALLQDLRKVLKLSHIG